MRRREGEGVVRSKEGGGSGEKQGRGRDISLPLRFTSLPFFLWRLILISNFRLKLWRIIFIKFKSLGWGRGYLWRGRNRGGES